MSRSREERRLRRRSIREALVFFGCIIVACGLPTWVEGVL